jgi:2-oxoglutarate dehydrogenase complex dihydrolipoamide succinyltransferase (E2) component
MTFNIIMPQLGESITEGTIVAWRKNIGDAVEKDEIILEISTDKVDSEIPSPEAGTLAEISVKEGETVQVGTVIATLRSDKGDGVAAEKEKPQAKIVAAESHAAPPIKAKGFLSPVVKKIIREENLAQDDLDRIRGSGANGRVTKKDVLAYLSTRGVQKTGVTEKIEEVRTDVARVPSQVAEAEAEIIQMDHIRKKIAENMVHSMQTAPHVTSVVEADVTRIVDYREKIKDGFEKRFGTKLTYTPFFIEIIVRALQEYPLLNASVDGDKIVKKKFINIGVAVGMETGLIVPVIKSADQLSLSGIAKVLSDLAERARLKKLLPVDVQGGTFSITNIGTFGNLIGIPIIYQPQVAILGTGVIKKRPVVINDAIGIRSMIYLSLTYDHRIIDGLYAGLFLQRVVQMIEQYNIDQKYS